MSHILIRAAIASLRVQLILVGLCYAVGWSPGKDSSGEAQKTPDLYKTFEDEEFGESGSPPPVKGAPIRSNSPAPQGEASGSTGGSPRNVPSAKALPKDSGIDHNWVQMGRDELFEKVFKKAPPPRLREFTVRLFWDDQELEQAKILWNPLFTEFQFFSPRLASFLDSSLVAEVRAKIHGKDGYFNSTQLQKNQFGVALDETEFFLKLSTPADLKRLQSHPLTARASETFSGIEIQPAHFSAYLNSNWYQNWHYNERFFSNDSSRQQWEKFNGVPQPIREPLLGDLNGAVRTLGWVLTGSGSVREPDDGIWKRKSFYRKETKLVHDYLGWNSRLSLLDVSAVHDGGNFTVPSLGGVDLMLGNAVQAREWENGTQVQFFLDRPAEVDVVVNGVVAKVLQLSSGTHSIDGFVGRAGENQVEIRIHYPDGAAQIIPYQFSQASSRIMPAGERSGSLSGGFRRIGENRYGTSLNDFVATGTYLQGISPFVSGKAGIGLHRHQQVLSAGLIWVQDSASNWDFSSIISRDPVGDFGSKFAVQYSEYINPVSLSASGSFIQASFNNTFFSQPIYQSVRYQLGVSVGAPIWKGSLNVNATILFNRSKDSLKSPIDYSFGANYSLSGWKGLTLSALGNCVINSGEFIPSASMMLSYFFNTGSHSFYAMNQSFNQKKYSPPKVVRKSFNDTVRVGSDVLVRSYDSASVEPGTYQNEWKNLSNSGWSWSDGGGMVGGKALSVSANYSPEQYGLRMGGQKTTNYADVSASYNLSDQTQFGLMSRNHYLSSRISTSLMFADGLFAVGRPVQDGFVLVKGQYDLANSAFRINPSEQYNSEYSHGNRFLAASYGLMSAYRTENIQVKPTDAPMGTFLDGDRYYARNSYQQGFVLKIGKTPRVFVRFRLIDETNQALGYTSFRVLSTRDSGLQIYRSFSSKDGIAQIGDLEPGQKYLIRFGEDAFIKDLVITIPMDAPRILNLGDQKVEHQTLYQLSKLSMSAPKPPENTPPLVLSPDPGSQPIPEQPLVKPLPSTNY